jgi:hypothetical protein
MLLSIEKFNKFRVIKAEYYKISLLNQLFVKSVRIHFTAFFARARQTIEVVNVRVVFHAFH